MNSCVFASSQVRKNVIRDLSDKSLWWSFRLLPATKSPYSFCYCFRTVFSSQQPQRLRRQRKFADRIKEEGTGPKLYPFRKSEEPITLYGVEGAEAIETNISIATLSPWVPIPDVVARKMFDLAKATPNDVHVDLGCGDGRVNFHAIDGYNVKETIGIDIDEKVITVANARLQKRHPVPTNIEFIVSDLLIDDDTTQQQLVWNKIQNATIITMFFATDGLKLLRPILERKLAGRTCTILMAGYEMPGWESHTTEVVLGTQIHMYRLGSSSTSSNNEAEDGDDSSFLVITGEDEDLNVYDKVLKKENKSFNNNQNKPEERFNGARVIDHTGKYPIQGYNPDIFKDKHELDWSDDEYIDFNKVYDDDEYDENKSNDDKEEEEVNENDIINKQQ